MVVTLKSCDHGVAYNQQFTSGDCI